MKKFKILDLFCGAGGFSLGLEKAGFSTLIGVDINKEALETFKHNFPNSKTLCGDLSDKTFREKVLKESKDKSINMIIGGPPCQGFSLKGKNLGLNDSRNYLFREYFNIVEKINPEIFIIENVKNILSSGSGYFKKEIVEKIEKMGYILNFFVLNAKDYGVPQIRERVFFVASKSISINAPEKLNIKITVKDAISDLAYLNSGEGNIFSDYLKNPESDFQKKIRSDILQYHISTNHSKETLNKLSLIPQECGKEFLPKNLLGKQKFSSTWSRLKWNDFSPTIDTRFDTPSNGRNSHPFLNRAITPREAARIQSFPDNFLFFGKKSSVCKQIGNAVPPLLSYALGLKIKKEYNRINFLKEKLNIINSNSKDVIKELIKNNFLVDHIITDPPYFISKKNNFSTLNNSKRKGIFFGEWDDGVDDYEWILEYSKLIKPGGSFIIFCSYRFISHICDILEVIELKVKDVLVWKKKNPMPRNTDRRYVQDMEFAVWSVKPGEKWIFNKPIDAPYARSFFETSTVLGSERTKHPTQKSLKLMEEIIKIHTNPGDLILDPYMGSGTTGVAALNLGRKFFGIELNIEYYEIAKYRLKNIYKN